MLANWVKNQKERKLIYIAIVASLVILAFGFWTIAHRGSLTANLPTHFKNETNHLHHPLKDFNPLKAYAKNKGSLGRIGVFAAFALFPLYFLIRSKKLKLTKEMKTLLSKALKWVKLVHVPISLIAFALITVHSIIMAFYEWKTNAVYLSGVISYILFLPLGILGFLRYKRKDKNLHYYLSFAFILFMLLHTFI
ncbi:hypothetical protein [Bacillus sp. 165]|uniref:hypothetical protein n=1 Tax=Bacillus sp. 165 TaxID=1529117 RepID=UPI001ADA7C2A|nr:hypothetical protein [Bacillus sp. 165]MBO9128613.1 hypothetical protein [Bacillus sp. 165]